MSPLRIFVAAAPLLLAVACNQQSKQHAGPPPAIPVEIMTLTPGTVRDTGEYLGAIISRRSITVLPQVSGYLVAISVHPGQSVTEGQPLMRIDAREEKAALAQSEAALKQIAANRDLARRTRSRSEALYKEGLLSQQQYDQARSEALAAEANVAAAEAQVKSRQVLLRYRDITAPFAGVLGDVPVKLGDFVTTQTALTSVDESETVEVSVDIPLDRAEQVHLGKTQIEMLNDQGGVDVSAPVFFLAPRPNSQTQLVQLKAAFANRAGLRQGQFVRARVVFAEGSGLKLPTSAVTRQSGQPFAFRVMEANGVSKVERKPVQLGNIQGNDYVLLSGLEAGERIAVTQIQNLRDGMAVKPMTLSERAAGHGSTGGSPPPADGGQGPRR